MPHYSYKAVLGRAKKPVEGEFDATNDKEAWRLLRHKHATYYWMSLQEVPMNTWVPKEERPADEAPAVPRPRVRRPRQN